MKKVILYQLNQLGFGGTEKAIYTFLQNLDKNKYTPKIFFYTDIGSFNYFRRKLFSYFSKKYKKSFHQKYGINFARKNDFINVVGSENFYSGSKEKFFEICNNQNIDIVHFNRGKNEDFYTDSIDMLPKRIKICETNIFGFESNTSYMNRLSLVFFVSKWLMHKSKWSKKYPSEVIYNPICNPKTTDNFREKYNIPNDAVVLGRISRPNLDDGEFIFHVLENVLTSQTFFMVIGATEKFKNKVQNYNRIICIDPTTDELVLSMFYNSLDILLHYRQEGETFGMNIAEAMIHAKPVISHYSSVDNAQAELLLEEHTCGIVVEENNLEQYINAVLSLINDEKLRAEYGKNAKNKAQQIYAEEVLTKELETFYEKMDS